MIIKLLKEKVSNYLFIGLIINSILSSRFISENFVKISNYKLFYVPLTRQFKNSQPKP